jgi:thiol:disulfide interchange protein DsbC
MTKAMKCTALLAIVFATACKQEVNSEEVVSSNSAAGEPAAVVAEKPQAAANIDEFQALAQAKLSAVDPRYKVIAVSDAGIENFYRVTIEGGSAVYMHNTGEYFLTGSLLKLNGSELVNLTAEAEAKERLVLMQELKPDEMIVFSPKAPMETKAAITVFTDVDCGYCQKLHQEVPELNAMGIEVRYMGFPRAGIGSGSHKKLVSAWCADDQQDAMTKLKMRQSIEPKDCPNPIAEQYNLGQRMGVNGTPAIFLEDGTLIPGYRPAKALAKELGI